MTLGELIEFLEKQDQALTLPEGFANPHSYRGYYDELAFEPAQNINVAAMLMAARSALGTTYEGWKGGDFTMDEHTTCHLALKGCTGEGIGPVLLRLMITAGQREHGPATGSEPAKVIIVTEAPFGEGAPRERQYDADMWSPEPEGALHVLRSAREEDPIIARYERGSWLSVREHGATTGDPYFTQGRKLAIALDALRDISDEPHPGYSPERAAKALEDIADVDL